VLFAVIDKTRSDEFNVDRDGAFAGIVGLLNSSVEHLSTEVGPIITMPPFQRTHVTTNAVGLLLQYVLDLPKDGGLGLRRVQWQANSLNAASMGLGEKMGFRTEGLLRWDRVVVGGWEKGKAGRGMQRGTAQSDSEESAKAEEMGRDTIMLGLCWDDWEGGGRKKVKCLMERQR
jgi:RimJ/RimL family protein N-acetyltransferase